MTGVKDKTAIYLTDEEIESFKAFCQYREEFDKLLLAGVFKIAGGHAEIHSDKDMKIRTITIQSIAFRS